MKTLLSGQVRRAPSDVAELQIIATHATTPSRQWTARPDDRGQFTLIAQDHAELRTNARYRSLFACSTAPTSPDEP